MTGAEEAMRTGGGSSTPLFAGDSYLREFDAVVLRAGPRFVVLDRTAFYPEAGGQPSDTGSLSCGPATVRVFKVLRRGGDIFHYIDGALSVGAAVRGAIDWEERYLNMRRHSGEHLLTGLLEREGAGPKVHSDLTRLEFQPSALDEAALGRVRSAFEAAVEADIPLRIYRLRRSEVEARGGAEMKGLLGRVPRGVDELRMVEIPGYSSTFCFGTHVGRTGEIGRLAKLELSEGRRLRKIILFALEPTLREGPASRN